MTDDGRRDSDIERHDDRRAVRHRQMDFFVLIVISCSIALLALVAVRSPEDLNTAFGYLTGVAGLLAIVRREN
ncbi:hypothetical protein J4573_43245 [Actinomadura barringtoniae]|uniref:Uncharacterized protein n=1 Tax=Actinomadura barringtoniae TaxID=1427535 RepID=A0A939T8B8_9ACTN|nr:hypothetical protein [Actinomadura barringtoniae]MBO2453968.1 hypothetical protein [Actinomadura barringtoniae]